MEKKESRVNFEKLNFSEKLLHSVPVYLGKEAPAGHHRAVKISFRVTA